MKDKALNVYKIIQYVVLLWYLAASTVHLTLKFFPWYSFHNDSTSALVYFAFLFSEIVNIACWVNFLIHLKACISSLFTSKRNSSLYMKRLFQNIRLKEKFEIVILSIMLSIYLLWNIGLIVTTYFFNEWSYCGSIKEEDSKPCPNSCTLIDKLSHYNLVGLSIVGSVLFILKILLGTILLQIMRRHLYVYYHKKYKGIILAIIISCLVITNKTVYNNWLNYREWDLKYNFSQRRSLPVYQVPQQFILSVLDNSGPVLVMLLNISAINFKQYLVELIKAWQLSRYTKIGKHLLSLSF